MRKLSLIFLILLLAGVSNSQSAVVTGENAFLRGSPTETGAVVDTLSPGTRVVIITRQKPWVLVQAPVFVGWMHGGSLRLTRVVEQVQPAESADKPPSQSVSSLEPPAADDAANGSEVPPKATSPGSSEKAAPTLNPEKRVYTRGPRGGCYYVRPDGKKVYGDHSKCG